MPIIPYVCECGHTIKKYFRNPEDMKATLGCEKCSKDMKRVLSAPSSINKIVVDNGFQARAVEIIPNIIELNEERANKNYSED